MQFRCLTEKEFLQHQKKNPERWFLNQDATLVEMRKKNDQHSVILAALDGEKILGYGHFFLIRHRKFFLHAICANGPILDYNNTELVEFFLRETQAYFAHKYRITQIYLQPLVNPFLYRDDKKIASVLRAEELSKQLEAVGYQKYRQDPMTLVNFGAQYSFVKDLKNMEEGKVLSQVPQMARYTIQKALRTGVQVKDACLNREEDRIWIEKIRVHTMERLGIRLNSLDKHEKYWNSFGEKFRLRISYLDTELGLSLLEQEKKGLETERDQKRILLEQGKVNFKKTQNRLRELEENIVATEKKILRIKKMQKETGSMRIPLSYASFLHMPQDWFYFESAALAEYGSFDGPYVVLYEEICEAIRKKVPYFNFWSIDTGFEQEDSSRSLLDFKRGFGGNIEEWMPFYTLSFFRTRILG